MGTGLSQGKGPGLADLEEEGSSEGGMGDACPVACFLSCSVWRTRVLGEAKTRRGRCGLRDNASTLRREGERSGAEGLPGIGEKPQRTFNFLRIDKTRHFTKQESDMNNK